MLWRSSTVWWKVLLVVGALLPVSTPPVGLLEWGCSPWPLSSAHVWEPHTLSCATAAFIGKCVGTCTRLLPLYGPPPVKLYICAHRFLSFGSTLAIFPSLSSVLRWCSPHLYHFHCSLSLLLRVSVYSLPTPQLHESPTQLTLQGFLLIHIPLH